MRMPRAWIWVVMIVGLIATACVGGTCTETQLSSTPVIPDDALREVVMNALGKAPGDPISRDDLETLESLNANSAGVKSLVGLEHAVNLSELYIEGNDLPEIDLSPVPGLIRLYLSNNQLTEVDLSAAPNLTGLFLDGNQLTEIDLYPVPNLTELHVAGNQLTEIDLSPAPGLTSLDLPNNQFSEIDLSPVPGLTDLYLSNNQFSEIDLSPVPGLTDLYLSNNQFSEIDLTPVFALRVLWLGENEFSEVDLTPVIHLSRVELSHNKFSDMTLIRGLDQLLALEELHLECNQINDFSPLLTVEKEDLFVVGTDLQQASQSRDSITISVQNTMAVSEGQDVVFMFDRACVGGLAELTVQVSITETGQMLATPATTEVQFPLDVAQVNLPVPTHDDETSEPDSDITVRVTSIGGGAVDNDSPCTAETRPARPFNAVEVVGGVISGSLALVADEGRHAQ